MCRKRLLLKVLTTLAIKNQTSNNYTNVVFIRNYFQNKTPKHIAKYLFYFNQYLEFKIENQSKAMREKDK
ncbi:hypothetical protein BpHYR1_043616 [Brachionus plicatilis]|uniref:Uncharacterized protein n=1 Tax=Brachionus plicatilis TaxID=10195 RepID=A0A3M7QBE3_BRAPC|nr:hypothetical protein BpHYR1_043616 [Brachionus plicatilis]